MYLHVRECPVEKRTISFNRSIAFPLVGYAQQHRLKNRIKLSLYTSSAKKSI